MKRLFFLSLLAAAAIIALPHSQHAVIDDWAAKQYQYSVGAIERSMQQPGAAPGAVVAAPSKKDPDYFYFWVRDGSLTLDFLAQLYAEGQGKYASNLNDFARFSRKLQLTPNRSGTFGEPKFNMDGSANNEDWGRPQNDGPGTRAMALGRYATALLAQKKDTSFLYKPEMPANSVVKADLEFVSRIWDQPSFDIWEEVLGHHFYTRFAQWRGLTNGAQLARAVNDNGAASYYGGVADQIKRSLDDFWDAGKGFVVTTLGRTGGLDYKDSNIDSQVLLASLHFGGSDGVYAPESDRILATTVKVVDSFKDLYAINGQDDTVGTAIGRYPEDKYNGNGMSLGNPWFLATTAIAEIHYKAARAFVSRGSVSVTDLNREFFMRAIVPSDNINLAAGETVAAADPRFSTLMQALVREGDRYMQRVQKHSQADGNLYEEFNRDSGFMQGAPELTWSHVAFCTAWRARQAITKAL